MHNENKVDVPSCDPTVSRKEFLQKVMKGAAITGGLVVAPKVLDKFIIQSAFASSSGFCTIATPAGNTDTSSGPPCSDTLVGTTVMTTGGTDTLSCTGDQTGSGCIVH